MQHINELTATVKALALDLGFELAGICQPVPPLNLDIYLNWVRHGRHAGMDYLARENSRSARSDPGILLPECQSILVVAKTYLPKDAADLKKHNWSISSYAAGDDYHFLIKDRLTILASRIENAIGGPVPHRAYTDTGPILEKAYAQQAGLGWIGKNGCLINPHHGSFLFLGELLLGLPLAPDEPFSGDLCGRCSACVDACPTSCILSDRTLDAGHCISYLTIEHRGIISPDLHDDIGSHLFGCDVCQDVCPWNQRFAKAADEPSFQIRQKYREFDLKQILTMDQETFRETFRRSPIKRTKQEGLIRNALIVAGNNPHIDLLPLVGTFLAQECSNVLRYHAACSLSRYPRETAIPILSHALENERHPDVREAIIDSLHSLQN